MTLMPASSLKRPSNPSVTGGQKNVIATPLKNEGSNLAALGIAGGTGILPVILMDRRDA